VLDLDPACKLVQPDLRLFRAGEEEGERLIGVGVVTEIAGS
jgi:hypothetical protein